MPTDREAAGAGSFGVSQHAQEAGFLSASSAGHRHREETCKRHLFFFFSLSDSFHHLAFSFSLFHPIMLATCHTLDMASFTRA